MWGISRDEILSNLREIGKLYGMGGHLSKAPEQINELENIAKVSEFGESKNLHRSILAGTAEAGKLGQRIKRRKTGLE